MERIAVFYLLAALWLLGFACATWTAGAPIAVIAGTVGLLGFAAAAVARIGAQQQPARRRAR